MAEEQNAEAVRLSKRMSELGLSSRREADDWIERGWVRVNGKPAVLGQKVLPSDEITVDQRAKAAQDALVTILINKPVGYVSGQAEDGYEPARVLVTPENHWERDPSPIRYSPARLRSLVPAGRLDIDSVGLLVLTQDGRVAKQIIDERSTIDKEYIVRVSNRDGSVPPRLTDEGLALLNHGLELDGKPLLPAKVEWLNESELRFVLVEGKKRQIRRMCELVGLKVTRLKRVRIGGIELGGLPLGQWRYLGEGEGFSTGTRPGAGASCPVSRAPQDREARERRGSRDAWDSSRGFGRRGRDERTGRDGRGDRWSWRDDRRSPRFREGSGERRNDGRFEHPARPARTDWRDRNSDRGFDRGDRSDRGGDRSWGRAEDREARWSERGREAFGGERREGFDRRRDDRSDRRWEDRRDNRREDRFSGRAEGYREERREERRDSGFGGRGDRARPGEGRFGGRRGRGGWR